MRMKGFTVFLGLVLHPALLQASFISNSTSNDQEKESLWALAWPTDKNMHEIFSIMERYANWCCKEQWGNTEEECASKQLSFWFWAKKTENPKTVLEGKNVNPTHQQSEFRPDMAKRICGKETPIFGKEDGNYPRFAMQVDENDKRHTEKRLLTHISKQAAETGYSEKNKIFYLFTRNSPCGKSNNVDENCQQAMFDLMKNSVGFRTKGHKLNVGFQYWFVPKDTGKTKEKARSDFCKDMTNKHIESNVNLKNNLAFWKTYTWKEYQEGGDDWYRKSGLDKDDAVPRLPGGAKC